MDNSKSSIPILILAGGRGTRLGSLTNDTPKPMVLVNQKPFIEHLISSFSKQGFSSFYISTGYQGHIIAEHFKSQDVQIIHENKPLGTGGAIQKSLLTINADHVLVVNGDTFFNIDLQHFVRISLDSLATISTPSLSIACKNNSPQGNISYHPNESIKFHGDLSTKRSRLNGGIYLIPKKIVSSMPSKEFSFEQDFLVNQQYLVGVSFNDFFIDIGTPKSYQEAQIVFKS